MSHYTIQCAGFDQPQQDAMSAVLDLAESALTDQWRILDSEDTSTVMINLDADNGQQICADQLQKRQPYQIILITEDQQALSNDHWFLLKKPDATPSLRSITQLLNQVSVRLAEEAEKTITAGTVPEADTSLTIQPDLPLNTVADLQTELADIDEPDLDKDFLPSENNAIDNWPEHYELINESETEFAWPASANNAKNIKLNSRNFLYGLLLQAEKDKSCRIVQLNRLPPIYIEPEINAYYFAGTSEEMFAYCTIQRRLLKSKIISKSKLSKLMGVEINSSSRSLTELTIYAVIQASQGRLLDGHSAERPVTLAALPNANEIPLLGQYSEIAKFMRNWEGDLYGVSEALQIPLAKVFEFYNACFVLGYITLPVNATDSEAISVKTAEVQSKRGLGRFFSTFFQN